MEMLFPNKLDGALIKLERIKKMIEELPEIKKYEESDRAIKEMDPSVLLRKLKQNWSDNYLYLCYSYNHYIILSNNPNNDQGNMYLQFQNFFH